MAQPITWKNIAIPDIARGQAALSLAAGRHLERAGEGVDELLAGQLATKNANWDQVKENQTADIMAGIQGTDDYGKLLAMKGTDFREQYGAQYDQTKVAEMLATQRGEAREGVISTGVSNLQDANLSLLERRTAIGTRLKEKGYNDTQIPGLTDSILTQGKGSIDAIDTGWISKNTQPFYDQLDGKNTDSVISDIRRMHGKKADYEGIKIAGNAKAQENIDTVSQQVQASMAQTGDPTQIAGIIAGSSLLSIDQQNTLLNSAISTFKKQAPNVALDNLYRQKAIGTAKATHENKQAAEVAQLATYKYKLEAYGDFSTSMARFGDTPAIGGNNAEHLLTHQDGGFGGWFVDKVNADSVATIKAAWDDQEIGVDDQRRLLNMLTYDPSVMSLGWFETGNREDNIIAAAKQAGEAFVGRKLVATTISNLESKLGNETRQFNHWLQQQDTDTQIKQLKNQKVNYNNAFTATNIYKTTEAEAAEKIKSVVEPVDSNTAVNAQKQATLLTKQAATEEVNAILKTAAKDAGNIHVPPPLIENQNPFQDLSALPLTKADKAKLAKLKKEKEERQRKNLYDGMQ